jgi:uncharacterized membrane protein YbaN (DUF454 family)
MRTTISSGSPSGKIVACALVLALLVVGIVGLVLPIVPGVLFLAIAALIAAKNFPSIDAQLRRHRAIDEHLDRMDRAGDLSLPAKARLAAWYCAKACVRGAELLVSFVAKLGARARY